MNSKEALNQLYILADTPERAMIIQSYYNIVEKDLEVLEILKKHFHFSIERSWITLLRVVDKKDLADYEGIDVTATTEITEEDYKMIKEWLEHGD